MFLDVVVFHELVVFFFIIFQGTFMVFHGFWLVWMAFQIIFLIFHFLIFLSLPSPTLWFFFSKSSGPMFLRFIDHRTQFNWPSEIIFLMVDNHRSSDAMFGMYRSSLISTDTVTEISTKSRITSLFASLGELKFTRPLNPISFPDEGV